MDPLLHCHCCHVCTRVLSRVKDEGAFEEVRRDGSALQSQQRGADGPKLTLGNRFDGLRDE